MLNVFNKLMDLWFEMLDGNLSIDGTNIPVYRVDVPTDAPDMFVVLRRESLTNNSNNSSFVTNPVIISEVEVRSGSAALIRDEISVRIDTQIGQLLQPTPSTHGLGSDSSIQIVTVSRRDQNFIAEDDGSYRIDRIVTRNYHRIKQR
jgi:hypothetical protein